MCILVGMTRDPRVPSGAFDALQGVNVMATVALIVAIGGTDEEVPKVIERLRGELVPSDPAQCLADVRSALMAVREDF